MHSPYCRLTADGTIIEANTAFADLFTSAGGNVVGRRLPQLTDGSVRVAVEAFLAELAEGVVTRLLETTLWGSTDRECVIEWTAILGEDTAEGSRTFLIIGRDTTGQLAYRTALQRLIAVGSDDQTELERRIPRILSIAHCYFGMRFGVLNRANGDSLVVECIADPTGELGEGEKLPLSAAYCADSILNGQTTVVADVVNSPFHQKDCFRRIALGSFLSAPVHVAGRIYGAVFFGDVNVRQEPFAGEQLSVLSLVAQWLGYELTAREKARQLEMREERYRKLYRSTPVMMHSLDWSGRLVEVSDTWLEQLGYTREEVIGRQAIEFMTEESRLKALTERLAGNKAAYQARAEPYVFRRKNGATIETEMSAIGVWSGLPMDTDGFGLAEDSIAPETSLCVLVDVTARNRAQRSFAYANAQLIRANEGLKRFNMMASHDLEEPLRKLRLFSSMLTDDLGDTADEESLYALKAIHQTSQRLSDLVSDLLAYTRQSNETFEFEQIELTTTVQDVIATMIDGSDLCPATFEIDALPVVRGGRVPIEQLLQNLLSNAIKYCDPERAPKVRIFAESKSREREIELVVRDNGIGIPQDQAERIFEPFRRLCSRNGVPGSGIGLAICRLVVQRHGWRIAARAAPQHGTDFYLRIPVSDVVRHGTAVAEDMPRPSAMSA